MHFLLVGGQTPPPLAESSAKKFFVIFFKISLYLLLKLAVEKYISIKLL